MPGRYRWVLYRCCTFGFLEQGGGIYPGFSFLLHFCNQIFLPLAGSSNETYLLVIWQFIIEQFTFKFGCCSAAPPNNKQNSRCCTAAYAAPDGYRPDHTYNVHRGCFNEAQILNETLMKRYIWFVHSSKKIFHLRIQNTSSHIKLFSCHINPMHMPILTDKLANNVYVSSRSTSLN